MTIYDELQARGLLAQLTDEEEIKELINNGKATFYIWIPVPKGYTSEQFATKMLEDAAIVVPPGNGYGEHGEGYIRIALTKDVDTIKKCLNRMKECNLRYQ